MKIEMVGRFIKQKDIRIFQYQAGKIDTGLFATGKVFKQPLTQFLCDIKPIGNTAALGIRLISTEAKKVALKAVVFLQEIIPIGTFREELFNFSHSFLRTEEMVLSGFQHVFRRPAVWINGNL